MKFQYGNLADEDHVGIHVSVAACWYVAVDQTVARNVVADEATSCLPAFGCDVDHPILFVGGASGPLVTGKAAAGLLCATVGMVAHSGVDVDHSVLFMGGAPGRPLVQAAVGRTLRATFRVIALFHLDDRDFVLMTSSLFTNLVFSFFYFL